MAKEKRKMGRPSTLTPEHIEKAKWYLDDGWKERGNQIPSVAGLSVFLGITRRQAYEWKEINTDFSHILDAIQTSQEMVLLDGGLSGDMNATIVKLALGKHDYSDKSENNLKNSDGSLKPQVVVSQAEFAEIAREVLKEI